MGEARQAILKRGRHRCWHGVPAHPLCTCLQALRTPLPSYKTQKICCIVVARPYQLPLTGLWLDSVSGKRGQTRLSGHKAWLIADSPQTPWWNPGGGDPSVLDANYPPN